MWGWYNIVFCVVVGVVAVSWLILGFRVLVMYGGFCVWVFDCVGCDVRGVRLVGELVGVCYELFPLGSGFGGFGFWWIWGGTWWCS